jgi:NADPH:quinone reductase-like Zn-dependent oxidoreductase
VFHFHHLSPLLFLFLLSPLFYHFFTTKVVGKSQVSVASPPSPEQAKAHGVRPVWFIVEPNRELLIQIGALIDAGQLRPIIDAVFPLSQARQAYEQGTKGHMRGKIVLRVAD